MNDKPLLRTQCLACGHVRLRQVFSLGLQLVTGFDGKVRRAPLELVMCPGCGLVQLFHSVPQEWFRDWYGYRSGINPSMRDSLKDLLHGLFSRAGMPTPGAGDFFVDIGSNDGTLLNMVPSNCTKVGFEPAKNLWEAHVESAPGALLLRTPFPPPEGTVDDRAFLGKVRYITAAAMFYDVNEPAKFLKACADMLTPDGVMVVQMNGLLQMVEGCAWDNVSHEHNAYYSLGVFMKVASRSGLGVFDVEENDVNGGSFRAYLCLSDGKLANRSTDAAKRIEGMLLRETGARLDAPETFVELQRRKTRVCFAVSRYISTMYAMGYKTAVYGASTRGLVIMESLDLAPGLIEFAAERNPEKYGRPYSGTSITCISEEEARTKAQSLLVLPYHFIGPIIEREAEFLKSGGELVVPLPNPLVIRWDNYDKEPHLFELLPREKKND